MFFQGLHPELGFVGILFWLMAGSLSSASVFGLARVGLKRFLAIDLFPKHPNSSLNEDEQTIQARLNQFQAQAEPILTTQERAQKIADYDRRLAIERSLKEAIGILRFHRDRYRARLWEIHLIRWHNSLKPIVTHWYQRLNTDSEALYQDLNRTRDWGITLLDQWLHTDLANLETGQTYIQQLRTALATCDLLYQDLITRQAAEVLEGISYFEADPRSNAATNLASEQLAVFNALPDVADFTFGLQDLEDEYLRLQTEANLGKELAQLQGKSLEFGPESG